VSLKVGDKVRVKPEVKRPSSGWGCVDHTSVGEVAFIGTYGDLIIDFPRHKGWSGTQADLALATPEIKAAEVIVRKTKRKSPEKVLAYGIMKAGELHEIETDRDMARLIKYELGGKRAGVTIVVLNAGKEIR